MNSTSNVLNNYIYKFCDDFQNKSLLFQAGVEGKITKNLVVSYLTSIRHLLIENAKHMKEATEIYKSNPILSVYFKKKWEEEVGHDRWAVNDIKNLNGQDTIDENLILPEIIDFTNLLYSTMHNKPYSYIGYMHFAELMTTTLGPKWLSLLNENLNLAPSNVTTISKHIELDIDHVADGCSFLDTLDLNSSELDEILSFYNQLDTGYHKFFNALVEKYDKKTRRTQDITKQFPAIA